MLRPAFIARPSWAHLCLATLLCTLNALWFALVYGGCSWITAQRATRFAIALPGELAIPLLPGMVLVYLSIQVLFLLGPFIVRERQAFIALNKAFALAVFIGGVGFLLVPAEAAYPTPVVTGLWAAPFTFADRLNLDYNMVPSLHVALSVCCVAAFAQGAKRSIQVLLWTWATAIAASTLLTHQHHVVDVVAGWVTGVTAWKVMRE